MHSAFIYSPQFDTFEYGQHHPFKPYRAKLVYELCYRYGLLDPEWVQVVEPEPAPEEALSVFHTPAYIDALKSANNAYFDITMLEHGLGTSDNPVFKGVFDYSLLSLGATLAGANLIAQGKIDVAFNPVGGLHHAGPNFAEGFCYVNDIVIAIKDLLRQGYERVLYVDIDAHHGNGVQNAFYDDPRVLTYSQHQSGETIYPGSGFENEMGTGAGRGYTVNVPLPEYTDDESYVRVFKEIFCPVAQAFHPQFVVTQIGLDTLKKDPLTNLRCTNHGYRQVIELIGASCDKVLALGGGGYSINDVARGWTVAWATLNHLTPEDPYAGLIGGAMYGHEQTGDDLFDSPHSISPQLKKGVDAYLDRKIAYLKENLFPLLGIG